MTDANGTRNPRTGGQSPNDRPQLGIPSSQFLPGPSSGSSTPTRAGRTDRETASTPGHTSTDRPKLRARSSEAKPTRRSRRTRSNTNTQNNSARNGSARKSAAERRRIFGTVPDRIKRKSSSRTRALKARTAPSPNESVGRKRPIRGLKRSSESGTANPQTASSALKKRPSLPATSPGRVPPARNLTRKRRRSNSKYAPIVRRGIQFLIVGLGIAAIGGTILKVRQPATVADTATETVAPSPESTAQSFPIPLTQEIPTLKAAIEELPNLYPSLTPKIFYVDVDTGQYVSIEGSESIAAASTIKLPILLAFFEEVDAGRIDPNQTIEIQPAQIAEGSGDMQISPPGTQFTALEVASQMIINSDNTATNMMIDLLGGQEALNSRFLDQGLERTQLNAPLPDLEGSNTTSARDLVHTMLLISQGEGLSMRSRDRILNILNRTYNKSLLANGPQEQGALTFNKTGDIASVLGDVALIDLPNGKRYVIAALVERPDNDGRAQELIRRISGQTYQETAKAIQPSVTPLGDPEADTTQSGETPADASTDTATSSEEAPYPSANP